MSSVIRKIEVIANVVIILSGVVLGILYFKGRLFSGSPRISSITAGTRFELKPAEWSKHEKNLVFAVREGCHYCSESASFYQRLIRSAENSTDIHFVAVLPQEIPAARKYLHTLGIPVSDVRQGDLASLQVPYTPTLMLLDREGVVRRVWVGKLASDREESVLKELGLAGKQ